MNISRRSLLFITLCTLISIKGQAQLSATEMALIEGLPMDISAALMETKTNPSAESDTMLNNVVQQNRVNQRKSQSYYEKFKTVIDLTPFNLTVRDSKITLVITIFQVSHIHFFLMRTFHYLQTMKFK